jgi:hypothetical protein
MRWIGVLALWVATASAQKSRPDVREVMATGCVVQPAEQKCLLLRTLDGKTTYVIFANTKPPVGSVVTISAKPHQGATSCKQGIPVDVNYWDPTGERCQP